LGTLGQELSGTTVQKIAGRPSDVRRALGRSLSAAPHASPPARTQDFDRLRWAGLRFRSGGKTCPVDADTEFPTLADLLGVEK
jgi:hypothetical protein